VTTAETDAAGVADGRSARSAKTREAIADALLDLLTEGNLQPTAREIAGRANVSLRSVYVHFDDLEDLYCVVANRQFTRVAPMLEPVPVDGPLRDRVDALMRRRTRLYTHFGAVGRATERQAPFSPTLGRIVRESHERSRRELERVFAKELAAMTESQRASLLAVVDVLAGPRAWEAMRDTHGLDVDEAERTLVDAILHEIESRA
jgi:AcrR family transcriptional regulator